ncbi:hypothetical protein E2C01_055809 [Portunus trituberculatus]|uniref:Uncharacterized protein n=1 Tax=Portunus trituberculatus TaxID=210409 RepID=A0A5B7GVR4_PORTR|nr:hypothetical protein [Portunus trituberculatus]
MEIYNKGVENFVRKYTKKTLRRKQWFNKNCEKAKSDSAAPCPKLLGLWSFSATHVKSSAAYLLQRCY